MVMDMMVPVTVIGTAMSLLTMRLAPSGFGAGNGDVANAHDGDDADHDRDDDSYKCC